MTRINRVSFSHIRLLEIISRQYLCQSSAPFIGSNLTSSPHLEHKNVVSVISTQTTCVIKRVRRMACHEIANYVDTISRLRIFHYVLKNNINLKTSALLFILFIPFILHTFLSSSWKHVFLIFHSFIF